MCTVTYIPSPNGFHFTSNRDELSTRITIPPKKYTIHGIELLFPKDELAGGTWFASNLEGKTACLLNGAFNRYKRKDDYAKSRGVILLDSFRHKNALEFSEKVELNNIEPFTLLTLDYQNGKLNSFYEFRWDGEKKHLKELSITKSQIWSSATLYPPEEIKSKKLLFDNWVKINNSTEDKKIFDFHSKKVRFTPTKEIIKAGGADLTTVSISQLHLSNGNADFNYFDLENNKEYKILLNKKEALNA